MTYTVGSYLAARLSQIGLEHHFAVAGDYNLALLDELLKNPSMQQVYCSNELNCGFSAGDTRVHAVLPLLSSHSAWERFQRSTRSAAPTPKTSQSS